MSDDQHDTIRRLAHLESVIRQLSPEDVETMRQIVKAYAAWSVLGSATKWFVLALASLSGAIIGLAHIGDVLKKWLTG